MYVNIVLCLLLFGYTNGQRSYENYKVYKVLPTTDKHVQMLTDLQKEYDFWSEVVSIGSDIRVLVSPEKDEEFIKYTAGVGLNATVGISNVQDLINAQMQPTVGRSTSLGSFNWEQYHSLATIHAWLDELQTMYPGIVTTVNVGSSYEGRQIKGVIIDFKSGQRGDNPLIGMIEGGIHAREWISPATVTWIIKEFLTSTDPDVRFMAETFVWHIIPVINPDGYSYTFDGDRMWRKNRNPNHYTNCSSNNDLSNGIDLNRNFNYLWMTVGASLNPCDQTFAGASAASEPEAQAIQNYVLSLKRAGNLIYYIAFHSYSQMVLIPYSHLSGQNVLQVPNYAELYEIAIRGAEKLTATHGTAYQVGTSADILYEVSGSSFDWVKGVAEVPIVYLFELRDVGEYGFLLPTAQIVPNNEEVMAYFVEMDKNTRRLGYYSGSSAVYASVSLIVTIAFLMLSN
ncbi:zinc carboxypeptidase-like [Aricia agestis]|uniref:zinc carboxypeptidase-like n=1 Tax=Aricia agestis TaxID=91739 RepID=UPI001C207F22|nr:zinc carboxypeptidase-like [Aricia agestis]